MRKLMLADLMKMPDDALAKRLKWHVSRAWNAPGGHDMLTRNLIRTAEEMRYRFLMQLAREKGG